MNCYSIICLERTKCLSLGIQFSYLLLEIAVGILKSLYSVAAWNCPVVAMSRFAALVCMHMHTFMASISSRDRKFECIFGALLGRWTVPISQFPQLRALYLGSPRDSHGNASLTRKRSPILPLCLSVPLSKSWGFSLPNSSNNCQLSPPYSFVLDSNTFVLYYFCIVITYVLLC